MTALTCTEMDEMLQKLDARLAKVDQVQGSRVKLPKAELELLEQIGHIRDFMAASMKDRDVLKEVFSDCTRVSRVRAVLDVVRLSGQNADDKRLAECVKTVDSIQQVVKESGEKESVEGLEHKLDAVLEQEKRALSERRSSVKLQCLTAAIHARIAIKKKLEMRRRAKDMVPAIVAAQDLDALAAVAEPERRTHLGVWMIWMVHRVYLNDPTLDVLNFTNCMMPPIISATPDPRALLVAPKLVKAIATNNHLKKIILANTNLRADEGRELGASLACNRTVTHLNVESNMLAPTDLQVVIEGVGASKSLQEFRCDNQLMGHAGRSRNGALDALLDAVRNNTRIVKLGMEITEPYFNNEITKQVMQNNLEARRIQKGQTAGTLEAEDEVYDAALEQQDEEELKKELEASDTESEEWGDSDASASEDRTHQSDGEDASAAAVSSPERGINRESKSVTFAKSNTTAAEGENASVEPDRIADGGDQEKLKGTREGDVGAVSAEQGALDFHPPDRTAQGTAAEASEDAAQENVLGTSAARLNEIKELFDAKAVGASALSLERAYKVMFTAEEKSMYSWHDFVGDFDSFQGGKTSNETITWPEVVGFLKEMG